MSTPSHGGVPLSLADIPGTWHPLPAARTTRRAPQTPLDQRIRVGHTGRATGGEYPPWLTS
ncbi:hypothetical protein AB8O64_01205 [Streptomyces sp. QH1-20]|uniref:hypothetical protein n=1 Tax=Streptomyces sp. QH1-20 TaxID=3240934 RepID=UPI003515B31E